MCTSYLCLEHSTTYCKVAFSRRCLFLPFSFLLLNTSKVVALVLREGSAQSQIDETEVFGNIDLNTDSLVLNFSSTLSISLGSIERYRTSFPSSSRLILESDELIAKY